MTRPSQTPPSAVDTLHDQDVADWLEARPRAALFFWDAADAACQRQRVRLEVVAAARGVAVGLVDVRSEPLVAQALGVSSVPTLVVFRDADVVERVMGSAPESVLASALEGLGPHPAG